MIEFPMLALAGAAGVMLGAMFFGGLWWTVGRGLASGRPALWFFGSLVLRTSIALAGFYFVSGSRWDRMAACLAGFLVARVAVTWLTRTSMQTGQSAAREASHAP